jgi:hypothetical protein
MARKIARTKRRVSVKNVKNLEARQGLLKQLRTAVCLQISLWDACSDVDETFGNESDVVSRGIEVTPLYAGKKLDDSDLDAILAGLEEMDLSVPIGQGIKIQNLECLDKETRVMLLRAFQNAISLQSELWLTASAIGETVDCDVEQVLDELRPFSLTADTGLELDEMDLCAFLWEPVAVGYARIGGPLEPRVRH